MYLDSQNDQVVFSLFMYMLLPQAVFAFFLSLPSTYPRTPPFPPPLLPQMLLKGQCHEIFCFWFFSSISLPPTPEYSVRTVLNFFENSRRYSQLKACHRCQRHQWQIEKNFNQKNFNNFVWSPLGSRGNGYINFCLQVHFQVSAA